MKKSNVILCLIILSIAAGSCKQTNNSSQTESTVLKAKPTEVDLGDLYSYYVANPTTQNDQDINQLIEYAADNGLALQRSPRGVFFSISELGTGKSNKWGDPTLVHYKGYTVDGKVFDSSFGRGEPFSIKIGNAIQGWNEMLQILPEGSKATLLVTSALAYAEKGFPGYIEPNTPLIFDIEIQDTSK